MAQPDHDSMRSRTDGQHLFADRQIAHAVPLAPTSLEFERLELDYPFADGVNAYRVGDTLVDTGHMSWRGTIERALLEGDLAGIKRVILTHPHSDHLGCSTAIPELADLPHIVYEGAPTILNDVAGYFRKVRAEGRRFTAGLPDDAIEQRKAMEDLYFPMDEEYHGVNVERVVSDGDIVRVGDYDCEVLHTPGHSAQHMSLLHRGSRTLFSGDNVPQNGHFMCEPLYWDLGEYEASLHRLREVSRAVDVFLPGHGPVMTDPVARIDEAIRTFERTRAALREGIRERGTSTARELTENELGASGMAVLPLTIVTSVFLHHLQERGECRLTFDADVVEVSHSGR